MTFATHNNTGGHIERMRINSDGNVGIGTNNPGGRLDVVGSDATSLSALRLRNTSSTSGGLTNLSFYSYVNAFGGVTGNAAEICLFATNTSNTGAGSLLFKTTSDITSVAPTEKMRITSGGFLKASNNGAYNNVNGPYHEFSNTDANNSNSIFRCDNTSYVGDGVIVYATRNTTNNTFFALGYYNVGAAAYKFRVADSGNVTNTNGSYGTISSDRRLKENIVSATSKLDDLLKLNVVNFNLIGNEEKHIGFIAQEMQEVFPSFVYQTDTRKYDEDGNVINGLEDALGVKVGMEFAILVKAIQELKSENDTLKSILQRNNIS
jgi:hypothetical protein